MRLADSLRAVARRADPVEALVAATRALLRASIERRAALESEALALADLAVSGQGSLARFERLSLAAEDLAARLGDPRAKHAAAIVLERARAVAARLARHCGSPGAADVMLRPVPRSGHAADVFAAQPWIAVSAEDDRPRAPVNIDAAPFPQHFVDVPVPVDGTSVTLRTRFLVAGRPLPDVVQDSRTRSRVILLLHGQSSRLEEYVDLATLLASEDPRTRLPRYTVIAPDLPSCGYTTMIDPDVVGTPPTLQEASTSDPGRHPILQFHDRFLVAFVAMLDAILGTGPSGLSLSDHIVCVGGGSLGASLALRLAELDPAPSWVRRVAAWSASSLWDPLRNDAVKGLGPNLLKTKMSEPETPDRRRDFLHFQFERPILGALGGPPQASMWYRDGWPLKDAFLDASRRARQEIYDADYRRWTYRLSYDQLQFSHKDRHLGVPYSRIRVPTLLAAGDGDNFGFARIRDRTVEASERMTAPGPTFVAISTGHSIHNERPQWLAQVLSEFLHEFGIR
jgi:pimeloyl-ACP methyl ester carboxylesterase